MKITSHRLHNSSNTDITLSFVPIVCRHLNTTIRHNLTIGIFRRCNCDCNFTCSLMPIGYKSNRLLQFPHISIHRRKIPIPTYYKFSIHIPIITRSQKIRELVIKPFQFLIIAFSINFNIRASNFHTIIKYFNILAYIN